MSYPLMSKKAINKSKVISLEKLFFDRYQTYRTRKRKNFSKLFSLLKEFKKLIEYSNRKNFSKFS